MNLDFKTIGRIDHNGIPCLVQSAAIPSDARSFWVTWRTCQDERLKKTYSIRKDAPGRYTINRIIPADPGLKLPPIPMPYALRDYNHLLPYQPRAVAPITRSLLDHGCAIDGSDTGLGKTYVSLAACREAHLRPGIICKVAGIPGWKRACNLMDISPLFIVNWETARTGKFPYAPRTHHAYANQWIYHWRKMLPKSTCLIFDECHLGQNDDTLNANLWTSSKGTPGIYLSATMADRPSRLSNLMYLLDIAEPSDYQHWLLSRGHFSNAKNQLESLSPVQDMKEIHKMLYPRFGSRLSYTDEDVRSYFPEAVYQVELVQMDRTSIIRENRAYHELLAKVDEYRSKAISQMDKMVAELRYRQEAEMLKVPVLADYATEYIHEGRSVCIFVNFRETLAALAGMLDTRSLIFGEQERMGLPREDVRKAFQSNQNRVIICMAEAGGSSIDLHDTHGGHQRISLICPTYNPITLKQILGRTYRAGAKSVPIMKLVYSSGTVEEKVAMTVLDKLQNIEALNKGDLMEPGLFD